MANRNQELRTEKQLLLLKRNGFISIGELARHCGISEITARRDLHKLAKQGKVQLVHGGATRAGLESDPGAYHFSHEKDRNIAKKVAIAKAAVKLIQPHDVLFLDSGSTVQHMTQLIRDEQSYTLLCYSLNIFEAAISLMNSEIILTGGRFCRGSFIFSSEESLSIMRKYRINKAFMGANGFHDKLAVTCSSSEAYMLKKNVLGSSLEKILLMDSSKFGQVTAHYFADISDLTTVITDTGIPDAYADSIRDNGVQLIVVDPDKAFQE